MMDMRAYKAKAGRVRGLAPWNPSAESKALVDSVQAVLNEYADYLPLTLRQVFYRLVGAHGYDKTERAYKRLGEIVNRSRRAGLISFDDIRDDGFTRIRRACYSDAQAAEQTVAHIVDRFTIDRQAFQPQRVVVWSEAAGMAEMLSNVTREYCIPVYSSGGFDSTTVKQQISRELPAHATVLHVGDHDPSGIHAFLSLSDDVRAFSAGDVEFVRLAVTPEQVALYDLITAPPKDTDLRRFTGQTAQAEALPPDLLCRILLEAIEERIDRDAHALALEMEVLARDQLRERFGL